MDARGYAALGSLDEQVVMVRHQTVGVDLPSLPPCRPRERIQPLRAITVRGEDARLLMAAGGHVVDRAGIVEAKRASHGAK
jgi:hypothetical protein